MEESKESYDLFAMDEYAGTRVTKPVIKLLYEPVASMSKLPGIKPVEDLKGTQ